MKAAAVLALSLILAGCASPPPAYVTAPLPLPPKPELPVVHGAELQCLSADAYTRLANRDRILRHYVEQLRAVIRSTHHQGAEKQ